MEIYRYNQSLHQKAWDEFVTTSKNGTFLFLRNYMDYHSDRFQDHSLLIYDKNKLIAILPANQQDAILISYGGLTYGSFVTSATMTTPKMLDVFQHILDFLRQHGFTQFIYKTIPYIYHQIPAEEDRYALFMHNAKLFRRDVLSVINKEQRLPLQERRRRSVSKASKQGLKIILTQDFTCYWQILTENLHARHGTKPVHSLDEIKLLHSRFPNNIKLFICQDHTEILAGVVIYETELVAHAQYIAANERGKQLGALDLLFVTIINEIYPDKKYFDFGIANENNGRFLNQGLIEQKEGFGGRAVVHDFYEITL